MRLSFSIVLAPAVAFAAGFVPLSASARELEYSAAAGCPSRDEVTARLEASAPNGRRARIAVRPEKKGFHGEVVLGEGDHQLARTVEAKSCLAVVEALALVVALDRDDAAQADDEKSAPPEAATPAPTPILAVSPEDRDAPPAAPPTSTTARVQVAVGLDFSGTSFTKGEVLEGGSLFVAVGGARGLGDVSWLQPSARLSFLRTLPTVVFRSDVSPEFLLTAGQLDLCPIGIGAESRTSFATCARAEIGSLDAGAAGDDKSKTSRLWASAGGVARARFLFSAGESVRPMLEASAGIVAPLMRDRFHFTNNDPIAAAPWLWTLAVGGGVVFP